ncbi:MAG TPA: dephospho-CoA kinase [Xanthobacteraceae bacterium]|nr:dephospho-CoA kinase [Xanthobacteraceae bacterium]
MIVLGLTGSIGMGKSTAAGFFADEGVPVYDADQAVHRLYAGAAAGAIEAAFPGSTVGGAVDRALLGPQVIGDPSALRRLEAIVHPLVRREEERFLAEAEAAGAAVVVLNIPLLFETGGDKRCDAVVVVSAPAAMQRERVLSRPDMTEEKFARLLAQQLPDDEKRRRADFVVDSSKDFESTRAQVRSILQAAKSLPRRRP